MTEAFFVPSKSGGSYQCQVVNIVFKSAPFASVSGVMIASVSLPHCQEEKRRNVFAEIPVVAVWTVFAFTDFRGNL